MLVVTGGAPFLAGKAPNCNATATCGKTAKGRELVEDPAKGANSARRCVLLHAQGFTESMQVL
jgi:hypothetical protein